MLAWNAFAALVFITMRNVIPTFFTTNAEVIAIASQLMVFAALYQLSDGIQNVSVGILRGIQDVKIIMPIASSPTGCSTCPWATCSASRSAWVRRDFSSVSRSVCRPPP